MLRKLQSSRIVPKSRPLASAMISDLRSAKSLDNPPLHQIQIQVLFVLLQEYYLIQRFSIYSTLLKKLVITDG